MLKKPTISEEEAWLAYRGAGKEEEPKTPSDAVHVFAKLRRGWTLPAHGEITNPDPNDSKACGKYRGTRICDNLEAHNFTSMVGDELVNHKGNVTYRKFRNHCDKPDCPICYKQWAYREGGRAALRMQEAERLAKLKADHIVISPPPKLSESYFNGEIEYSTFEKEVLTAMRERGIMDFAMLPHPARYANKIEAKQKGLPEYWRESFHFHAVGFVPKNDRCRKCSNHTVDCMQCSGFEGICRRIHLKDRFIFKVKPERKSLVRTFYYQLTHVGLREDNPQAHTIKWYGQMSYRNMKFKPKKEDLHEKCLCPLCGAEMKAAIYCGANVTEYKRSVDWDIEGEMPMYDATGAPNFIMKS
jgi:hypothetical protein